MGFFWNIRVRNPSTSETGTMEKKNKQIVLKQTWIHMHTQILHTELKGCSVEWIPSRNTHSPMDTLVLAKSPLGGERCSLVMARGQRVGKQQSLPWLQSGWSTTQMPSNHPFAWRKAKPIPFISLPVPAQPLQSWGHWKGNKHREQTACQINAGQACLSHKVTEVTQCFWEKCLKSAHNMNLPCDRTSWTLKLRCWVLLLNTNSLT